MVPCGKRVIEPRPEAADFQHVCSTGPRIEGRARQVSHKIKDGVHLQQHSHRYVYIFIYIYVVGVGVSSESAKNANKKVGLEKLRI